jgi:Protein of unknown function (DUF2950)
MMRRSKVLGPAALAAGIAGLVATITPQSGLAQESFASPEAAMSALLDALATQDQTAMLEIFGAEHEAEILGDDPDAASEEQARFLAAARRSLELRPDGDDRRIAYVGLRAAPFAIPIVLDEGGWRFDTEEGIDELANQRIGGNELRTIDTVRAYVDAQNAYASADRDGDEVLEYAQHIRSSAGEHDGLYWAAAADQPQSPIGPLLAAAVETREVGDAFNGYHYRVLTRQGANPPGGAYDYVINGNMIAGFGLIAWPADYDHSGIMTFIVNHQGKVYEKDLGPETAEIAATIAAYDPDDTWTEVTD